MKRTTEQIVEGWKEPTWKCSIEKPLKQDKYTDTELIDALEKASKRGSRPGLVNDDSGRWAVSESGFQNCSDNKKALDISPSDHLLDRGK
jgi:hypothetical protein